MFCRISQTCFRIEIKIFLRLCGFTITELEFLGNLEKSFKKYYPSTYDVVITLRPRSSPCATGRWKKVKK